MNFTDAGKVSEVIQSMRDAGRTRATNRARINDVFNGSPPYTETEAWDNNFSTNVNFLEPHKIAADARGQFNRAFLQPANLFTVKVNIGPIERRDLISTAITGEINRMIKRKIKYKEVLRQVFAQLVLHGIGPVLWPDNETWCPDFIGIDDLLLPSRTYVDLSNMNHFAVLRRYTPWQLWRMTHGKAVDPGWNMKLVNDRMTKIKAENVSTKSYTPDQIEQMSEDYKSNGGYYASDCVPTVDLWDFYYLDDEDSNERWFRRMVEDDGSGNVKDFIYKSPKPYAESIERIIHFQFADGANVAPFRIHSIRSLGFLLYAVCLLQNRLRCRFNDAIFESMLTFFRNVSGADRERIMSVDLHNMGVIPEGISMVPANERHVVSEATVMAGLNQNRQLMSEHSAAFTQDIESGTQKEMTATEAMARVNSANSLIAAVLGMAFEYQVPQYREICRRFCVKNSKDKDVQGFQDELKRQGIPLDVLDVERWDVDAVRSIGSGNQTLEMAKLQNLMAVKPQLDPAAQRKLMLRWVDANLDNPLEAIDWVPLDTPMPSETVNFANLAIAPLMLNLPVIPAKGLNRIEYIETLMQLLQKLLQDVEASGELPEKEDIMGYANVINHIQQWVKQLAEDKTEGQRVKVYMDMLGRLMNTVKGYAQRVEEQQAQQGPQMAPEAMAKVMAQQAIAESTTMIKEAAGEQKLRQKEMAFASDQQRKDAATLAELKRKAQLTQADVAQQDLQGAAQVKRENFIAANQPKEQGGEE